MSSSTFGYLLAGDNKLVSSLIVKVRFKSDSFNAFAQLTDFPDAMIPLCMLKYKAQAED